MGAAKRTTQEMIEFFQGIFTQGYDTTLERLGWSDEEARQIMAENGLDEQSITLLTENELFRQGLNISSTVPLPPELSNLIGNVANITQTITNDFVSQGGRTNETREVADRTTEILRGITGPQLANTDLGFDLVSSRGSTSALDTVRDRNTQILDSFGRVGLNEASDTIRTAADIVATGGATPKTDEIFALGSQLVQQGGFTPEMTQAFDTLLSALNSGFGNSAEFDQLWSTLSGIVSSEGGSGAGILPLNEFVGFVQADAAKRSAEIAEAAAIEATRRGLAPGAVSVADGGVSADAAAAMLSSEGLAVAGAVSENQQLRAAAISDALRNMTQLVSSQMNDPNVAAYASVLGDIIRSSAVNIGTGAEMTLGAADLENQRLAYGLQSVAQLSTLFSQREQAANQNLLAGEQLRTQRTALGSDILNREIQTRLAGGELLANTSAVNSNNLLAALQTGLNAQTVGANIFLGNQQQQLGFSLDSFNSIADAWLNSMNISSNLVQNSQQNRLSAAQLSANTALPFLNIAGAALPQIGGGFTNLTQLQARPGFFEQLGSAFASGLGSAAGSAISGGLFNMAGDVFPSIFSTTSSTNRSDADGG